MLLPERYSRDLATDLWLVDVARGLEVAIPRSVI